MLSAMIGYDWGADADITDELESIIKIGDGFLDQEDHASASTIYQAVAEEVLSHYDTFEDEGGELCGVVNDCVEGLGRCLGTNDDATRERIMRALFDIYRFDVDFGGVGLGDDVPGIIMDYATSDERHTVADWVQASILPKEKDDWSSNWYQQVYGGFLLNLRREELDDEAFLHICRETGRLTDLIEQLHLGRKEEAVIAAEKAGDYELLQLADIFISHGHDETAGRLIVERAKTTEDSRILDWLKVRYKKRGELSEALFIAQNLFEMHSNLSNYQEIHELAQQLGIWENTQTKLLNYL